MRGDVVEPEESRGALDAVHGAEDLVQRVRVRRAALLELQQERLDRLEMLEGLDHELGDQIRIREHIHPCHETQSQSRADHAHEPVFPIGNVWRELERERMRQRRQSVSDRKDRKSVV